MRVGVRRWGGVAIVLGTLLPGARAQVVHEARWGEVDLSADLPPDLVRPEGKTRWDLRGVAIVERFTSAIEVPADPAGGALLERRTAFHGPAPRTARLAGTERPDAARRWLLPHEDPELLAAGPSSPIRLERIDARGARERLWIRTRRAGLGWLFLPSGPRQVVLQQALVMRAGPGSREFRPEEWIHRWVDPRAGVVAEVRGRATADGRGRRGIEAASVVEEVSIGELPLHIYSDEAVLPLPEASRHVRLGWDLGGHPVSELTTVSRPDVYTLATAGSWDFTPSNPTDFPGIAEIASSTTVTSAEQTANFGECGLTADKRLSREDLAFDDVCALNITLSTTELEDRTGQVPPDQSLWLRAAVQNEGASGGVLGEGESRICYESPETQVQLQRFGNEDPLDPGRWFYALNDMWSDSWPCTNTIREPVSLYTAGEQRSEVVGEGPVTLPSGHTFDALVIKQVADFGTWLGSSCNPLFKVADVLTALYLWEVPYVGTVVRIQSEQEAMPGEDDFVPFTADIKYGLFPPRSISVTATTADAVDLAWDPGLWTDRITRYKVYWDTVSGADSGGAYACDSDSPCLGPGGQPETVTFNGTTATVSGLTSGQEYFFTVTAVSELCDAAVCRNAGACGDPICSPDCDLVACSPCDEACDPDCASCRPSCTSPVTYESFKYPVQIASAGGSVPAEVSATPGGGCVPSLEVHNVLVGKATGGIEMCWDLSPDPCVEGYQILGADTPEAEANYLPVVDDTGPTNCWVFDPAQTYFLVVGRGSGGTGPTGHFPP